LLEESAYNYQAALEVVPVALHERLADPDSEVREEIATQPAWCLCEMPEGDYSRVRVFPDLDHMVKHIGRLEGEEVSVWAFYGTPLRITQPMGSPGQRYLLISEQEVIPIPHRGGEVLRPVSENQILPEVQEDGWLGDAAFTQGSTETYYAYEAPSDDQFDGDGDEEEGEEVDV
jgi:hypothetical protein|tara:strand:- start:2824 stop:3345 length:522 start_codon:yes stop_codon:yes gene_type:complete